MRISISNKNEDTFNEMLRHEISQNLLSISIIGIYRNILEYIGI